MWVRAVAVAVAVVCCVGTAQAGQYAEVWNPPEARPAPKKIKVHAAAPAATRVAGKSVAGGGKGKQGKAASVHAAHQAKPHARLAAKGAPAGKTVKMARGKGVRVKGAPGKPVKMAHAAGVKKAAVKTARSGVAGPAQTAMRPKSQRLASKAAPSTRPASAMASAAPRTAPVQPAATMANATASPATNSAAGGGNLPPILH